MSSTKLLSDKDELIAHILQRFQDVFKINTDTPMEGHLVHIPIKPDTIPIFRKVYDIQCHLRDAVK